MDSDLESSMSSPQKRVIDSPISLKTTTRKTSTQEISKTSHKMDNDLEIGYCGITPFGPLHTEPSYQSERFASK